MTTTTIKFKKARTKHGKNGNKITNSLFGPSMLGLSGFRICQICGRKLPLGTLDKQKKAKA